MKPTVKVSTGSATCKRHREMAEVFCISYKQKVECLYRRARYAV